MPGHCDRASCQIALSDVCACVCFGCTYAKLLNPVVKVRVVRPEDMAAEAALLPKPSLDTSPLEEEEDDPDLRDQDPLADIPEILEQPNENDFGDK